MNRNYIILEIENPYCVVNSQGKLCESIIIYPWKDAKNLNKKINACIIYSLSIDKFLLYTEESQATIGFNSLISCVNEYLEADTNDNLCTWIIHNKEGIVHKCFKYKVV
jgi:hypothetical protein